MYPQFIWNKKGAPVWERRKLSQGPVPPPMTTPLPCNKLTRTMMRPNVFQMAFTVYGYDTQMFCFAWQFELLVFILNDCLSVCILIFDPFLNFFNILLFFLHLTHLLFSRFCQLGIYFCFLCVLFEIIVMQRHDIYEGCSYNKVYNLFFLKSLRVNLWFLWNFIARNVIQKFSLMVWLR